MNEVQLLAELLGFPNLIDANRDRMNSTVRQAISYYLKRLDYQEKDIAVMQKKSRATIYHHIKTFEALLDIKDSIAISLWEKLTLYPIKQSINQLNKPKNSNIREK